MSDTVRTVTYSDVWIDEFNNVRQSTDFELVLGKINEEFRFIPQGITMEQGLTPEMLDIISSLIRKKAGIGEKKAEPIKEDAE
ncbi:MAG: hypothetical protein ACXADH_12185 [Candidatus Kariarchaeaceae archaeon]|jgi:hypothetical protein